MEKEMMWNKKELKEYRDWTDAMIKKFAPNPDKTAPNPFYRSGPPVCLYDDSRIREIEATAEFQQWIERHANRKYAAESRASSDRKALADYIDALDIIIPVYSKDELLRLAARHYNDLWSERGRDDKKADSDGSDDDFLCRIATNFLRHECSNYEYEIVKMFGKTGKQECIKKLHERINNEIYDVYPHLNRSSNTDIKMEQCQVGIVYCQNEFDNQ